MQFQRGALIVAGWTNSRLHRFLQFTDCEEQLAFWHTYLNTSRFQAMFDAKLACDGCMIRLFTRDRRLPLRNIGRLIRGRLERGFARHPNSINPYAQRLLGHGLAPVAEIPANPIRFETADAAEFLEAAPSGSFNAFSLSNIADGAAQSFRQRLLEGVKHAASSDAIAVLRSFGEPVNDAAAEFAARDRAMLWGSVQVAPASALL
jgi:hypothetical protein